MGYRQLTQDERYVMARLLHQGYSYRSVAVILDRAASTISREHRRNVARHDGRYRAEKAQQYAMARRSRSRKKSQYSLEEWAEVARLLKRKWSPEQIAGRRRRMRQATMSKESIYRYVRRERRAGGQLWRELRILSLAFLHRGLMFVGVSGSKLMARVGKENYEDSLGRKHVREMDFTGKPMQGHVYVEPPGFKSDEQLEFWLQRCKQVVSALPPKAPK